jgi:hypothetical protein
MSLVEQELLTLPEHLSSPPVFSGVRVTRSLVLYVCFVDRCLSFFPFSFGHCVFCSSSIYGFWLPIWYLQTLLFLLYFYDLYFCFFRFSVKDIFFWINAVFQVYFGYFYVVSPSYPWLICPVNEFSYCNI